MLLNSISLKSKLAPHWWALLNLGGVILRWPMRGKFLFWWNGKQKIYSLLKPALRERAHEFRWKNLSQTAQKTSLCTQFSGINQPRNNSTTRAAPEIWVKTCDSIQNATILAKVNIILRAESLECISQPSSTVPLILAHVPNAFDLHAKGMLHKDATNNLPRWNYTR